MQNPIARFMPFWTALLTISVVLCSTGCSQKLREAYSWKNIIIGACLGVAFMFFASLSGGSGDPKE